MDRSMSLMENAEKRCRQESKKLEHYLKSVERERRLRSGLYRREASHLSQSLRNSASLAETVAQYSRTALSWQNDESEESIRKFLTLPKATVEFKHNMEKRKNKTRQILIPNADASFSLISISSIETGENELGKSSHAGKRGGDKNQSENKHATISRRNSTGQTEKYLGRPTCVLPPLVQGKTLRAPRSLYQLQYLSKLDETLKAATLLPKEEHKNFSTCLRSFSEVHENPV